MNESNPLAGYKAIWTSFRTGTTQIFLVDLENGDTTNLTRTAGASHRYPSWSPDGKRIAFTSDRDGTHNLYVLDIDTMSARQLTHESAPVVAGMQTWTADGNWIYFGLFGRRDPEMCRINPDGSRFEGLGAGIDPAISPDGRVMVYAKNDQAGHYLFAAEPNGKNERQLTVEPNSFAGVHAFWTPDGEKVIYADRVENALELFSVAPDSSRRQQLTSFRKASTSPFVSPDGAWVTFRLCDEIYWRDPVSSERAYRERKADFRPVWLMGVDGSNPRICELMHYHTTIDGSKVPIRKT